MWTWRRVLKSAFECGRRASRVSECSSFEGARPTPACSYAWRVGQRVHTLYLRRSSWGGEGGSFAAVCVVCLACVAWGVE